VPEKFRFEDPRVIQPAWPHFRDEPWLEGFGPADEDRPQLETILRRYDDSVTEQKILHANARELFTGRIEGFDEEPIEIWDIVDDDGYVRYTLWLFLAAQGVLFEAGGTKVLGEVIYGSFHADDDALDMSEARVLTEQLTRAQKETVGRHPKSVLVDIVFERSFTY
jgi:hypothetical protein